MSTDTFNLRNLIRTTVDASTETDPAIIAKTVVDLVPRTHLKDVLHELMPFAVRELLRSIRHNPLPAEQDETQVRRGGNRSTKFDQLRDEAHSPFTWRVFVPTVGEWKFLGDCTAADLAAVADGYFSKAAKHTAVGNNYARLAEGTVGVECVSELGEERFWLLWNGAAA